MPTSRTLILMRHAAAGGGAHRDHDRRLTPSGAQDATAAGDWIRQSLPAVDAVLSSTAVRTRQTLAATRIDAPARFADELYGGGIDDILEQIALTPDDARTVLVVGHAPGIPSVAHELATVAALIAADSADGAADPTAGAVSGAGGVADAAGGAGELPEHDGLRFFSAGALAVLTTDAPWAELANQGATLVTVRHPDR